MVQISLGHLLDRWSFMGDNEVMLLLARGLGFGIGAATLILGFISIFTFDFNWCPQTAGGIVYDQCFGPSLRWNNGGPGQDFVADANQGRLPTLLTPASGWRSVFTFDPEFFFPLWGPIIIGYITMLQHFKGRVWGVYRTWPRVSCGCKL